MGYFKRTRAGISISLDPVEAAVLEQVIGEMSEVIGQPERRSAGQEWAHDLGLGGLGGLGDESEVGESAAEEGPQEPEDAVRARLFPAGYRGADDVDGAASEFRRFTEDDLRAGKAANAQAMLRLIPEGGGKVVLDEEGCASWLGALNDARLALGTALEVDANTEYELATLEPDEPRAQRLLVYHWLGELQSSLLDVLMG